MTTEDNKLKREKIAAKIRALLAKTTENGATEAEALAAATAAARLMEQHDLTYENIEEEVRAERFGVRRKPFRRSATSDEFHEVTLVISTLRKYFNVSGYRDQNDGMIIFFGAIEDTGLCVQMAEMIQLAMEGEFARYLKSPGRPSVNRKTLRHSFMQGMAVRLVKRLDELRLERDAADVKTRTGKSLMVVKSQVVTDKYASWLRENGISLRNTRAGAPSHAGAYNAGQAAGGRVDLGGSGKLTGQRMIGH